MKLKGWDTKAFFTHDKEWVYKNTFLVKFLLLNYRLPYFSRTGCLNICHDISSVERSTEENENMYFY
jgi:hypothetical protein